MSESNFEVALTKCFFCNGDHQILMNSLLTPRHAANVKQAHGMVIDMSPCNKCEEMMKMGVILITIDPAKSTKDWNKPPRGTEPKDNWMPNPYRTGGWFVVRDEFVRRVFEPAEIADYAIKHRWMFIEDEAARMMGLFDAAPSHDEKTLKPKEESKEVTPDSLVEAVDNLPDVENNAIVFDSVPPPEQTENDTEAAS